MTDISSNRLSREPSAYLRQHADNPVHWQPWGKDALNAAHELNRPILLSVGYAACHWCHVMAHESFEDPEVAGVMNRLFVNVKVDREERPDIDQIYMAALSAMGQQGGWPLTMFLRPDGKPFWGGTYFPPQARHNLPGFVDVLKAVNNLWQGNQEKINHNAEAVFSHLEAQLAAQSEARANEVTRFNEVADRIHAMFDPVRGGIDNAPKFPNAPFIDALWLSWLYNREVSHRDMFLLSLKTMLQGGIYDHLGGGLCRYSVDADWLVPHFEKMLYDNAQVIRHATYAYAETQDDLFRIRIEEIIEWLVREMRLPNGGFASSLDADSEGEEGKFYIFSEAEIDNVLGDQASDFKNYYGVKPAGNFESNNILNRLHAVNEEPSVPSDIADARDKLLDYRNARVRPGRDEKALTDWNALMIRALAEAGRSFKRSDWIEYAVSAYRSIGASFHDGRMAHCQMDDVLVYPALSTDYAAMMNAALSLFEATGDRTFIRDAIALKEALDANNRDASGNYRLSALNAEDVILHSYGDYDEAIPSATSQIIEAFTRLFLVTGDLHLYTQNERLVEQAMGRALVQQYGQIGILNASRFAAEPLSLVIADESVDGELSLLAQRIPDPRRVDKFIQFETGKAIELPTGGTAHADKPSAWLCKGQVCLAPVETPAALEILLRGHS
ncbi:thioredoxin domain-containing protein [Ochrobactrum sp. MYb15]|uniref:thioredoxin domain-containing protein n=1 Tax=Brucella TaxID=234 RepID=UPI000463C91A|nr:thioredoxin domain-containing protein [Brucella rhizosphaerae]PQZ48911.1 thioredoxin domain-containing protein [Ochrobactrum sp. MYb19]PRA67272.1 thioredoxin domain-containing protein [Ochrobactrum sp. MYb18]PRA77769.1 thioredoxin domain-containing protein [Brucella thiophenivorans]PRA92282.1 thioredoxin domain-containing protein [Ochrobactrum sp. MYb14]PRA99779.1 thioredoxin domain-containing protein [Ochrobactrum sp. MYb15]